MASNPVLNDGWRPAKPRPRNHGKLFLVPARIAKPRAEVTMLKRIGVAAVGLAIAWLVFWA